MTTPTDVRTSTALSDALLTIVPAAHPHFLAQRTDWSNQTSVHRSVMALFASDLPGEASQRRAGSHILYRLETNHTSPRVLIQSAIGTRITDHGMRTTTLAGLTRRLPSGTAVAFRVDVNAVRSQARTGRRLPLPIDAIADFLLDQQSSDRPGLLAGALTALRFDNVELEVRRTDKVPLHVAHVIGTAHVDDPEILTNRLINGIGRAKSYGCGLLSVVPT